MTRLPYKHVVLRMLVCISLGFSCTTSAKDTVIHAGHLIDGVSKQSRDQVSILIKDERIVAVQNGFVRPSGAEIIDLSRATVLPGLIDAHVHITSFPPGGDPIAKRMTTTPIDAALYATVNAKKLLLAGFTSVRNAGAGSGTDLAVKRAIEANTVIGPRMWVSLEAMSITGGHSDPQNGLDPGLSSAHWQNSVADGPEEYVKLVREHKRRGADFIKIMPSWGVLSIGGDPKLQSMTNEEIRAAIDTAHGLGMKVAAHAHSKSAIDNAIKLGVDSIEHGSFADEESFALYKKHNAYLVPTLLIAAQVLERAKKNPEQMNPSAAAKALEVVPSTLRNLGKAYQAGVKIAFGTDTSFGENGKEFALMVNSGMPAIEAIQAATNNAAELLGASANIGSIQAGRYADIIAVQGDPLKDITELERVAFVMKAGVVYKVQGK